PQEWEHAGRQGGEQACLILSRLVRPYKLGELRRPINEPRHEHVQRALEALVLGHNAELGAADHVGVGFTPTVGLREPVASPASRRSRSTTSAIVVSSSTLRAASAASANTPCASRPSGPSSSSTTSSTLTLAGWRAKR